MDYHSLIPYLSEIDDLRHAKGKHHPQLSTLSIMVMAMLCGHTELKAMARFARMYVERLAQVIPLPKNKPPSYSTLQRTRRERLEGIGAMRAQIHTLWGLLSQSPPKSLSLRMKRVQGGAHRALVNSRLPN